MRLARLLQRLGVNAVPAAGFFVADFTAGTTIALYWLETVLATAATTLIIVRHRQATRKAGHWLCSLSRTGGQSAGGDGGEDRRGGAETFSRSFLGIMIPFTAIHGFMVALVAGVMLPRTGGGDAGIVAGELGRALPWLAALMLVGLAIDLTGLRGRSFAWLERAARRTVGRMIVIHLTIVFGLAALTSTGAPRALFAVFVALKAVADLGGALPAPASRETPPRWLAWIDSVRRSKTGETLADHWRQAALEERRRVEAHEAEWLDAASR